MDSGHSPGPRDERPLRSALFVDFDNIYLTLHAADPRCAEGFATEPTTWIHWLERGLSAPDAAGDPVTRRILLRRCYLNPMSFRRYRSDFTRAGFRVVDCPSLTRAGKSSSDIHMVMDILDALQHETRFDEFILLSGDADFTPVLQRLREHDRRTSILAIGPAAAAYKASSDEVIDEARFVQHALGLPPEPLVAAREAMQRQQAPLADPELLHRVATVVREAASSHGPVLATELPGIYKRFPEFPKSNWLGFYSLRGLSEAVVALDPGLTIVEADPWRIEWHPLGADVVDAPPDIASTEGRASSELRDLMRRVQELTGAPPLLPQEHAAAFSALSAALADAPSDAVLVAKMAADTVLEQGHAIPRSHLTFILQTLAQAGHDVLALGGVRAAALADRYRDAIAMSFEDAGRALTEGELDLLDRWICRSARERVAGA